MPVVVLHICRFAYVLYLQNSTPGLSSDEQNQAQIGNWHGVSRLRLV